MKKNSWLKTVVFQESALELDTFLTSIKIYWAVKMYLLIGDNLVVKHWHKNAHKKLARSRSGLSTFIEVIELEGSKKYSLVKRI